MGAVRGIIISIKEHQKRGKISAPAAGSHVILRKKAGREAAKEPWLIFSSTNEFEARKIMKLYNRRKQIEQNVRDEKNERFGFGLRASHSHSAGRLMVLSLLATLATILMWLLGYHAEKKDYI